MSKYDWSNVPKDILFIATDDDGVANGFTEEPKAFEEYGLWLTEDEDYICVGEDNFDVFDKSDWMNSLEKRP